ncbi:MAG TPA: hypothetical protein VNT03_14380 [Baekduia sp.]|nr:hypothetical protein [Baekduia sp.]
MSSAYHPAGLLAPIVTPFAAGVDDTRTTIERHEALAGVPGVMVNAGPGSRERARAALAAARGTGG